jgi:hypothetical protein
MYSQNVTLHNRLENSSWHCSSGTVGLQTQANLGYPMPPTSLVFDGALIGAEVAVCFNA